MGLDYERLHIIGHSLGAQIAANIANNLDNKKIARITGKHFSC